MIAVGVLKKLGLLGTVIKTDSDLLAIMYVCVCSGVYSSSSSSSYFFSYYAPPNRRKCKGLVGPTEYALDDAFFRFFFLVHAVAVLASVEG